MTRPDDAGPGARKRRPEGDGGEAPTGYGEITPEIDDEGHPVEDHAAVAEHLEGHNESAGDSAGLWSTDEPLPRD
jgi:hypothetical protein